MVTAMDDSIPNGKSNQYISELIGRRYRTIFLVI